MANTISKTAEFHTLLRNYRGIVGNMRIGGIWISFDSCFFNYYDDDDEIQFNLAGQEGIVTIPTVEEYDKLGEDEELLEDSVAGYTARLKGDITLTVYCFNAKIIRWINAAGTVTSASRRVFYFLIEILF